METNPICYGLPSYIKLEDLGKNSIGINKMIKSRIIQKDAIKIISLTNQLKSVTPELDVTLICTTNICSKSITMLELEDIQILYRV